MLPPCWVTWRGSSPQAQVADSGPGAMTTALAGHENQTDRLGLIVAAAGLLCVPFIQFGVSYWLSVQGALFWLALIFVRKRPSPLQVLLYIAILLTMVASLLGHTYSDTLFYAFLRIARQSVCLFLIVCAATSVPYRLGPFFFERLLPLVIILLSGLVLLQFVTYNFLGWTYLFVPSRFYVQGFSTLADSWLQFGENHGVAVSVRPSATYAEPSYFGFVALGLAMMVFRGVQGRMRVALLALMLVALFCSKSASGVVLFICLVAFAYRRHLSPVVLIGGGLFVTLVLIGADVLLDFHLLERVLNITDTTKERSGYIRLILPIKHVLLVLEEKPLGVPLSEFFNFTSHHVAAYQGSGSYGPVSVTRGMTEGTDNGFLNLFITFGFGAFVMIGLLCLIVRDKLNLVFLLFVSQFNGDLLSPDKAALVALVLICHRAAPGTAASVARARRTRVVTGPFGASFLANR
jgi:hypothetical protein